jgi:hypothetical protein
MSETPAPPKKRKPHNPRKHPQLGWLAKFDQRERTEILLALQYTHYYNHGTSGHLSYNVIAKLAIELNWAACTGNLPEPADLVPPEEAVG